jgi:hypothetical protein
MTCRTRGRRAFIDLAGAFLPVPSSLPRRISSLVLVLALALPGLVATAPNARAGTPEVILGRPRVGEFQPVRGSGWIAWQQNTRKRPRHYDVLARSVDNGSVFRVNPPGTNGANGDIEGDLLVYQQFERKRSGLRFFDLATREQSKPPPGINTEHWEYWPSTSGQWLLFGRLQKNTVRRIILFDLSTGVAKRLAKVKGANKFLAPGQVNGPWAVWYRCPSRSECNIVRYHISTGESDVIANPHGLRYHAPSIDPEGTVYYARARGRCGNRVRLIRERLDGSREELWRLPNGDDIGRTHAQVRPRGNTILYDHFSCGQAAESDAWQIAD